MSESAKIYSADYTIRSDDLEPGGAVSAPSLAGLCLDTAGRHAAELGLSVFDLFTDNRTWVLSRFALTVEQHPGAWDKVTIKTWPTGAKRLFAHRNFLIYDSIGIIIGAASSAWLVIDTGSRRPVRIQPLLEKMGQTFPDCTPDDTPDKLSRPESPELTKTFAVRLGDIDLNDHVTSKSYMDWALESVPPEIRRDYVFNEFTINYVAETFFGESVAAHASMSHSGDTVTFDHVITSEDGAKDLALARSIWRIQHKY